MIYDTDCTLPDEYLKQLTAQRLEGLPDLVRVEVNQVIQITR